MKLGSQGRMVVVLAVLATAALPAWAQSRVGASSAMDGQWHCAIAPYMWFSGIKGDVSVADRPPIPVDAPFSDIWSNFDFGLEGHLEARKDRLGLGFDFIWSNLGVPVAPKTELADFNVDVRQLITEGFVFYRVASGGRADNPAHLDVILGARYTGTRARLQAEGGLGAEYNGDFQKVSWVDGLAGLKLRAPLGSRFAVLGRGDVGGFGSQLTWNVSGDLAFLASVHWALGAGWRYMDIDYEKGEGVDLRVAKLAYNGPRFWFAYAW